MSTEEDRMPRTHAIAILGMGPKGLHCLERLLAEANAHPLAYPLHIHVFNRSADFGASPIYDPHLPDYILVNISVGEIDLWTANDPPVASGRGPDFLSWYRHRFPALAPLKGNEYLPRAVVGQYLIDGFRRMSSSLPPGIALTCHHGDVVDVEPCETRYRIEFISAEGRTEQIFADKVLLATGHSQLQSGEKERGYQDFTRQHTQAMFLPHVYPVRETMARIPEGARVAMKGIGLTFIDAVLELTEGRGGRFDRTAQGSLAYQASGREPKIFPFSRSGLPMAPKSFDLPQFDRPLTFLDASASAELLERSRSRKLDLQKELWPLVEAELQVNYYRVAMETEWRRRLEECGASVEAMHAVTDSYHRAFPSEERFQYLSVLDPAEGRHFENAPAYNAFVEHYMEVEIVRARLGQVASATKAAIEIWYECRKVLSQFLQFGGLTPASQKTLLEHWSPKFKRVVFGPPVVNIEKLLALCTAGIIDFGVARNPSVMLEEASGLFNIRCEAMSDASMSAEVLVDARYPSVNVARDAAPLYRGLNARGMIRPHKNVDTSLSTYISGAIDMTRASQFVIDANGAWNEDIAVIGIPTEGNLVGNLTLARDPYSAVWASQVLEQLRIREAQPAS